MAKKTTPSPHLKRTTLREPKLIPTMQEFEKIVHAEFQIPAQNWSTTMDTARDYFVLSCTTYLSYSQIINLSADNIVTDNNGEELLVVPALRNYPNGNIPLAPLAKYFILKLFAKNKEKDRVHYMSINAINMNLHELFRQLGINTPTIIIKNHAQQTTQYQSPKYDVLTMKSAKDFFLNTAVNSGIINLHSLMVWSKPKNLGINITPYLQVTNQSPMIGLSQLFDNIPIPK